MSKYIKLPHDHIGAYKYDEPVLSADDLDEAINGLSSSFVLKRDGNAGEVVYRTGDDNGIVNQRIFDNSFLVCEN